MQKIILSLLLSCTLQIHAQTDSSRRLRAFPVTDYMVDLSDSVKIVQVELPEDLSFADKQLGLIRGVYTDGNKDTTQKGYGRCHLIKGQYYYFAIHHKGKDAPIKPGDLLYTFMPGNDIYDGQVPKLASHFIRLLDVYDQPLFDRFAVFRNWTEEHEKNILDSMIADIRFTGNYFMENDPAQDKQVLTGRYAGRSVFVMMKESTTRELIEFLDYMIARPRLYAGREWKISEIFATWLSAGAPFVPGD